MVQRTIKTKMMSEFILGFILVVILGIVVIGIIDVYNQLKKF